MDKQDLIAGLLLTQRYLCIAISMLENDPPCEEVLHQIATARAALDAVEFQLLENQLQSSFDLIRFDPCPDRHDHQGQTGSHRPRPGRGFQRASPFISSRCC
jgi:hypothetical protein